MSIMRTAGMIALACTGVGALYMLSRMQWVKPNNVGIVINYSTQKYEMLEPGLHCILNPMRFYQQEVSTQTQFIALGNFSAKSLDNVDSEVQADITFVIDDPQKLYYNVKNPITTFIETVKGAFSSAIQTLPFQDVTSAEINNLAGIAGHVDGKAPRDTTKHSLSSDSPTESLASLNTRSLLEGTLEEKFDKATSDMLNRDNQHKAAMAQHGASFFRTLLDQCRDWGIVIKNFRIISLKAAHPSISNALELTAKTKVEAEARLRSANSQAATITILATAQKAAQLKRAEAAIETARAMGNPDAALEVYTQENAVRSSEALGNNSGLLVNAPSISLGNKAFAAFSGNAGKTIQADKLSQPDLQPSRRVANS
jgi:regulator of protease activity HflC (stomatin/prohibitin superfamily)